MDIVDYCNEEQKLILNAENTEILIDKCETIIAVSNFVTKKKARIDLTEGYKLTYNLGCFVIQDDNSGIYHNDFCAGIDNIDFDDKNIGGSISTLELDEIVHNSKQAYYILKDYLF